MRLYKSPKPPEYNLSNVQTKVHIIFGTDDFLVRQEVSYLFHTADSIELIY